MHAEQPNETTGFDAAEARRMSDWKCVASSGAKRTRYRETLKYDEGLYELENARYAWMVPNGSWGESNAGLIAGDGASLLADTL